MAIQGLLLDFDGTLLDSEPWHHQAWNEVLREHQNQITEAQYMSLIVGHATAHCAGIVNRHLGTDFEAKWLEDAVDAQVNEWFQSRPLPVQTPHPPIHLGGMSMPAYRRAVAQCDGWYGFFQNLEATELALRNLEDAAKKVERPAGFGKLEISITPPGPVDADMARRYEDLGVDRLVLMRGFEDMSGGGGEDVAIQFVEEMSRELALT